MRRLLVCVLSLAVVMAPATAAAGTYISAKWRTPSVPFTVTLVNMSVTDPLLVAGLHAAAASWSESPTVDVVVGSRGKNIVKVYEAEYGSIYGLAWFSSTSKSGHGYIQTASIHFNTTHLSLGTANFDDVKGAIVCHEVGHALGLGHVETEGAETCMTPGANRDYPSEQDFINLAARYE